jgi:hypothetical protein
MSLADETDFPFIIFQLSFFSENQTTGSPSGVLDGELIGSCIKRDMENGYSGLL